MFPTGAWINRRSPLRLILLTRAGSGFERIKLSARNCQPKLLKSTPLYSWHRIIINIPDCNFLIIACRLHQLVLSSILKLTLWVQLFCKKLQVLGSSLNYQWCWNSDTDTKHPECCLPVELLVKPDGTWHPSISTFPFSDADKLGVQIRNMIFKL